MTIPLADFMEGLFQDAIAVVPRWQLLATKEHAAVHRVLERAHTTCQQDAPLGAPDFSADVALWAAQVLHWSSWMLLNRLDSNVLLPDELAKSAPSGDAIAEHWSVDLSFRFMPSVIAQGRRLAERDGLLTTLADLIRGWPLSAVGTGIRPETKKLDTVLADDCLKLIYRDRTLARGDTTLKDDMRLRQLIDAAVGNYPELASGFAIRG